MVAWANLTGLGLGLRLVLFVSYTVILNHSCLLQAVSCSVHKFYIRHAQRHHNENQKVIRGVYRYLWHSWWAYRRIQVSGIMCRIEVVPSLTGVFGRVLRPYRNLPKTSGGCWPRQYLRYTWDTFRPICAAARSCYYWTLSPLWPTADRRKTKNKKHKKTRKQSSTVHHLDV